MCLPLIWYHTPMIARLNIEWTLSAMLRCARSPVWASSQANSSADSGPGSNPGRLKIRHRTRAALGTKLRAELSSLRCICKTAGTDTPESLACTIDLAVRRLMPAKNLRPALN